LVFSCIIYLTPFYVWSEPVLIIEEDSSLLNADEQYLVRTVNRRIPNWLTEIGVDHITLKQSTLSNQTLSQGKIALLPFNPKLTVSQIQALDRHLKRGGKIIVCASSSKRLGEMMFVRPAAKIGSHKHGAWCHLTFAKKDTLFPQTIYQHNWSLYPVRPAEKSTTLAYWHDEHGSNSQEPALIKSPHGYWFTSLFLDGDKNAKQQLLFSCISKLDSSLWRSSIDTQLKRLTALASKGTYFESVKTLKQSANSSRILPLLKHCEELYKSATLCRSKGQYEAALIKAQLLNKQLQRANVLSKKPFTDFDIGVWDHNGAGIYTGNWSETAEVLSENGITQIYPNMLWTGKAHFPTPYTDASKTLEIYGDQLAKSINACHKKNIEVHLWKVCWRLSNANAEFRKKFKGSGRLQVNAEGKELPWLSPAHPANQELEINAMVHAAKNYKIDGIHLDYIRYPDRNSCFSKSTRASFERYHGAPVTHWPKEVLKNGKLAKKYEAYRAWEIHQFVKKVNKAVKAVRPSVNVSVAVFGKYPSCVASVAQDYRAWLKEGSVDTLIPMNYTHDPYKYRSWLGTQSSMPGSAGKVMSGIGVIAQESELALDEIIQQMEIARSYKNPGVVLFKLDHAFEKRILPALGALKNVK